MNLFISDHGYGQVNVFIIMLKIVWVFDLLQNHVKFN